MKFEPKLKETRWSHDLELAVVKTWEKEDVYRFRLDDRPVFSIDTPPPYASGRWHVGAAVHYTQIDMIARYFRLRGYNVLFPMGIDRNGLPVEMEVEKRYNVKASEMDRREFIRLCESFLDSVERELLNLARLLAISADYKRPYRTDSPEYRALTQATFIELWKRGLIYEDDRPTNWCPVCRTSIADAEIEYVERETDLYYIDFELDGDGRITIATTRPELIGACRAVLFHPEDERYRHLEGRKARVPIYGFVVPIISHPSVKAEFGTGLMMLCSYGDYTDIRLIRELRLEPLVLIDESGKMNERSGFLKGLNVEEARRKIVDELYRRDLIRRKEKIVQSVPTCWRSHNPIEFIHMREYYLKQLEFRDILRRIAKEIRFYPPHSVNVLLNWIDSLSVDWPISRRRFYGTEIPIWYCKRCGTPHVPETGRYYRPWAEEAPFDKCSKCGHTEFIGEERTLDTWFDSSISALFISGYARNERLFERAFPVSMRPQGVDIVRTWLYYTLLRVYQLTERRAFERVRISGMGLDERGEAMHKSRGNVIDPEDVVRKYSVEALRFWGAAEAKLGSNYRYSDDRVMGAHKFITKLWNVARFISSFPVIDKPSRLTELDELILGHADMLLDKVVEGYENLDVFQPANAIRNFVWNVFAPHYVEMLKPRAYNQEGEFTKEEQRSAWYALHSVLKRVLLMLHPINPLITDYIWRRVYNPSGIVRERFPEKEGFEFSGEEANLMMEFNSKIWRYKKTKGLSLRSPLRSVVAPPRLAPFAKDLRAMHRIEQISFSSEKPEGTYEDLGGIWVLP